MSRINAPERVWTREAVIEAIRAEALSGQELSYMRSEQRDPTLVRAGERMYGSWSAAVQAAGFDYAAIRRYQKWTRERVIARIQELHAQGADLSWRNVSLKLDPALAAATLQAGRFASWADALAAAGLNPDLVMRYRRWSLPKIQDELLRLSRSGVVLNRQTLSEEASDLLAALYRHGNGLVSARNAVRRRLAADAATTKDDGLLDEHEDCVSVG